MVAVLRDEFLEQLLLLRASASGARDLRHMPQRVTGERRISVGDSQEERPGFGAHPPVLQQTREQVIVIVPRERVGVVVNHLAQQRFGPLLIITIQRRAQPLMPLQKRLRLRRRAGLSEEHRRDVNEQRDQRRRADGLRPGYFMEKFGHRETEPHFTLLVLRLMKSIITYSPRRLTVVKYALP